VAARRRAFVGWLGELLVPDVVLGRALEGRPNIAVRFSYRSGASHVVFSHGHVPAGAISAMTDLHNRWVLQTFAPGVSGALFLNANARLRLIGGFLLSLFAGTLILVLATGRRRALAMVAAKTRELSHQATHDSLTGLPNRALVFDRASQLIARGNRTGDLTAALFVDIDGFKQVNDSLGHAAGDQLLKRCAARLLASVRAQDTVGRLGGDEFVVLLEANPREPIEALADRINTRLRAPVPISEYPEPVQVTASIGIACGQYASPDDLLRDADLALYQAKAAGKNRHAVFAARDGETYGAEGGMAPTLARVRS
jgi:diguanylate cyclase (GGDEF)-like protein